MWRGSPGWRLHAFLWLEHLVAFSQCIGYSVYCNGGGNRTTGMVITWCHMTSLSWSHDLYTDHMIPILVTWPLYTDHMIPILVTWSLYWSHDPYPGHMIYGHMIPILVTWSMVTWFPILVTWPLYWSHDFLSWSHDLWSHDLSFACMICHTVGQYCVPHAIKGQLPML